MRALDVSEKVFGFSRSHTGIRIILKEDQGYKRMSHLKAEIVFESRLKKLHWKTFVDEKSKNKFSVCFQKKLLDKSIIHYKLFLL